MNMKSFLKSSTLGNIIVRRTPVLYGQYRAWLAKWDRSSPAWKTTRQAELTARTLALAAKTPRARQHGLGGPFEAWPLLEKDTLRDQADRLTAKQLIPVSRSQTGGTTGIPLVLTRSWQSVVFEQAMLDHLVAQTCGLEWSKARVAILRGETLKPLSDMSPPFHKLQQGGKTLTLSSYHLSSATVSGYLEALQDFRPDLLWAYPSALESLCGLTEMRPVKIPGLKAIVASSEFLSSELHLQASEKFGAKLLNYYSQAERVCLSYSADGKNHFFHPAYGRVELQHAYNEGKFSLYEIIGTSFWNKAQPLVRYKTGDLASLPIGTSADEIDEICLGLRSFNGIVGRQSEYLISPSGEHLIGLNHIPRGIPDIVQMQLHQKEAHRVEIWIVPQGGFGNATKSIILQSARQRIPETMAIDLIIVDRLFRTKRGKAPLVIRSKTLET